MPERGSGYSPEQHTLDVLRRLSREPSPRQEELQDLVKTRGALLLEQGHPPVAATRAGGWAAHAAWIQDGWPRAPRLPLDREHFVPHQTPWTNMDEHRWQEGTIQPPVPKKVFTWDHVVWNWITVHVDIQTVASLQVTCSAFRGRLRYLIPHWLAGLTLSETNTLLKLSRTPTSPSQIKEPREHSNMERLRVIGLAIRSRGAGFDRKIVAPRIIRATFGAELGE